MNRFVLVPQIASPLPLPEHNQIMASIQATNNAFESWCDSQDNTLVVACENMPRQFVFFAARWRQIA